MVDVLPPDCCFSRKHCVDAKSVPESPVRPKRVVFRVWDLVLFAELLDDGFCPLQVPPRHVREAVVLDLVVESAHHNAADRTSVYIVGGDYLLDEFVYLLVRSDHRSVFMVGGKYQRVVDAERALMDESEDETFRKTQKDQEGSVPRDVQDEQA